MTLIPGQPTVPPEWVRLGYSGAFWLEVPLAPEVTPVQVAQMRARVPYLAASRGWLVLSVDSDAALMVCNDAALMVCNDAALMVCNDAAAIWMLVCPPSWAREAHRRDG
jgi:hypothetical protein